MIQWIQVGSHVIITIVAVVALALRVEHRMTKIETDVGWLIKNNGAGCERKDQDGGKDR